MERIVARMCIWGFPKIGDPNIVPQNKAPLIVGNSHIGFAMSSFMCGLSTPRVGFRVGPQATQPATVVPEV